MKYRYKESPLPIKELFCKMCGISWEAKNYHSSKIIYYYDVGGIIYCGKCIEQLETTDPDFAVGLESE